MSGGGLVLGLDTSTVVAVGLARAGTVLGTAVVADRMAHVEQLTPLIKRCLESCGHTLADLDGIVVGLGPGPFTGLRVGIVTARTLGSVLRIDVRGVCSLDVLAAQWSDRAPGADFLVATDARRREVYWARYDGAGHRIDGPEVSSPDDLPRLPTIGPAADLYADRLLSAPGPRTLDPGVLAAHGSELSDAGQEPLYLRRPDAVESVRRKSVLHHRGTHHVTGGEG